jgi:MYXO-CTERM domain-containing protein
VPTIRVGWACDDFDHALDIGADAICFYKPGLRQVLDAAGWDGPVWLTEAGYRGDPWDDARAQARQQATVEYIVDRQRETPWWQATFFYELTDCRPAQPDCGIDGFGLMRRVAGAGVGPERAAWREHFVFKPSFEWLRAHLANAPPPPPPPPPPMGATLTAARLDVSAPGAGSPGGSPSGRDPILDTRWWDSASCVLLEEYDVLTAPRAGPADLSARVCAMWHADALHLGVEVGDQTHTQDAPADALWQADALQVAIDVLGDGTAAGGGYRPDDVEVTVALAAGATRVHLEHGALAGLSAEVARVDARTVYALRLPLPNLAVAGIVRFSVLVNDADGGPRKGWLAFTPGIGRGKDPDAFGQIILLGRAAESAGGGPPEGPEADAGRPPPPPPPVPDGGPLDGDLGDGATADASTQDAAPPGNREFGAGSADAQGALDGAPGVRPDAGGRAGQAEDGGCTVAAGSTGAPGRPLTGAGLFGVFALLGLGARRTRRRRRV